MTVVLTPSVAMQFILCTVGCIGFGMMFNVQGRNLFFASIGALLDWTVYYIVAMYDDSTFIPVFVAASVVAIYAQIMARLCKAPATIFLTVSVFPLIPGARMYYMVYNMVMGLTDASKGEAVMLLTILVAIATGFIVVAVFYKYLGMIMNHVKVAKDR